MGDSYIRHIELLGFERRFFPSQHYVYMFLVKWSDLSEKLIYRKFSEIYAFHKALKEMFPIESGDIDIKDRILPPLPAPKWFDNQKTTETRQGTLAEYCHSLINLPPKISRCQLLLSFYQVREEDENPPAPHPFKKNETYLMAKDNSRSNTSEITGPIILQTYRVIADYNKGSKYQVNLKEGEQVDIVEKSTNGWWFCQCESRRGWVPASYLEPLEGPDETEEQEPNYAGELFVTTKAYTAEQDDELTLQEGETIEVIHKLLEGWWVIRKGEQTGHYPSMFLRKSGEIRAAHTEREFDRRATPPPRRSTIRNAKSIHTRGRQRISQDTYRRNSRRYLHQRGQREAHSTPANQRQKLQSVQESQANNENNNQNGSTPPLSDQTKALPTMPPRPSKEVILERCTEHTRKKGEQTGHYPSMFLRKSGEIRAAHTEREFDRRATPPPRRSTIRNAKSIHTRGRQRISQDTYRRNSRRYLHQRGQREAHSTPANQRQKLQSVQESQANNENNNQNGSTPPLSDQTKALPTMPPRPSKEVILERCTEHTRKKVSIRYSI